MLLAAAALTMGASPFHVQFAIAGEGVPAGASFTLRVEPDWAPLGAARFKELGCEVNTKRKKGAKGPANTATLAAFAAK